MCISETVLQEILRTGQAHGRPVPLNEGAIPRDVGRFLDNVVREIDPLACIEVGLGPGVSALFIRGALRPQARYIAIDPYQSHPSFGGIGLDNLRRARHAVEFYEDTSQAVLPRLWQEGLSIDFAFIDGWHTFDHALLDFWYLDRMLRPGGVIAFDDTDYASIYRVVRFVLTNRAYRVFDQCRVEQPEPMPRWLQPVPNVRRFLKIALTRYIPQQLLKTELARDDVSLGLGRGQTRCVAVTKLSDDARGPEFHSDF